MAKVHELLAEALNDRIGKVLSNKEIIELTLRKFPGVVKESSIVIKDHAKPSYPHAPNCRCVDDDTKRLFDWLGRGRYRVRTYLPL